VEAQLGTAQERCGFKGFREAIVVEPAFHEEHKLARLQHMTTGSWAERPWVPRPLSCKARYLGGTKDLEMAQVAAGRRDGHGVSKAGRERERGKRGEEEADGMPHAHGRPFVLAEANGVHQCGAA
jgi:hypothetical protein